MKIDSYQLHWPSPLLPPLLVSLSILLTERWSLSAPEGPPPTSLYYPIGREEGEREREGTREGEREDSEEGEG